jgi:ribosome-associated translation inhibitor RaiA
VFAKGSADSLYKTLDKVVERAERQLEKHKDQQNRIHRKSGAVVRPEFA